MLPLRATTKTVTLVLHFEPKTSFSLPNSSHDISKVRWIHSQTPLQFTQTMGLSQPESSQALFCDATPQHSHSTHHLPRGCHTANSWDQQSTIQAALPHSSSCEHNAHEYKGNDAVCPAQAEEPAMLLNHCLPLRSLVSPPGLSDKY